MMEKPLIAVINDDPAFLEFIASFLEQETNYRAIVWDDGIGSLAKLREHLPSAVIIDVRLGEQTFGHEILSGIREDELLKDMPVIVCTADSSFLQENIDLLEALRADVLEKPFDLDVLEEKVKKAIDGSSVHPSNPDPVS